MPPSGITSTSVQADPLPSKRGEIGYIEFAESSPTNILSVRDLPPNPHPDDRDSDDHSFVYPDAVSPPLQPDSVVAEQSCSTASITKSHGILDLFKPEGPPAFGGLRLYTLVILAMQLILLGGTVAVWVLVSKRISQIGQLTIIPFHIIFVILVLVQLLLLERRLFRLYEERYNYVRPGEILPRHRSPRSSMILSLAPWNRPSLPTYAVALSESGVGTGDVEDLLIPYLPPPAYGNTRESTLVLQNIFRASSGPESSTGRPQSYVCGDEQGDLVQNADIARRLEETINRLEPPSAAHVVIR